MSGEDLLRELLAEGLDLCVRARRLDRQIDDIHTRAFIPESVAAFPDFYGKCATPHIWVTDQYDRDLEAWELRSRNFLLHGITPVSTSTGDQS